MNSHPHLKSDSGAIAALLADGKLKDARGLVEDALARHPADAELWHLKGLILSGQGDKAGAIVALNQALKIKPDFVQACFDLACVLEETASLPVAIKTYQYLQKIAPNHREGATRLFALQSAFQKMLVRMDEGAKACNQGDMENAVRTFREAIAIHPRVPDVWSNLGLALYHLRQADESKHALLEALRLQPGHVEALNTLGNLYERIGEYGQAAATYRQLIAVAPDYFRVWANLGKLLMKMGDDAGAIEAFERARRIDPSHAEVLAELTHRLHHLCRWGEVGKVEADLIHVLQTTQQSASPFIVTLYGSPKLQLENAKRWASQQFPTSLPHDAQRKLPADSRTDGKLRIGYFSADFHHHATAFLISELFERHDKERFEIYAYSCGQADDSAHRKRIVSAVSKFRDIRTLDNRSAAELIGQDAIDIMVDLKGYTQHERMDLMALRPAPIQMHYLGYPSTTGAPFIDYFIADSVAAPAGAEKFFSERLIRLPHCYQINDRKRPLPEGAGTRAAHGLPPEGFVFCGFNRSYKITPLVYDVWIRLLKAVPGSVLWLYEPGGEAAANLKREASARGVDPARIIIVGTMPQAEHLQRYRHVDLFLDTFPVCGHTTASDALWCGVPVVTVAGVGFAGRVAASLLQAVGLPELASADMAGYEALALGLAREPEKLQRLKKYLEEGRAHFPLFDSLSTTRALEAAYLRAAEYHRAGLMPQAFAVAA